MATATHGLCQRDAVKVFLRAQANLDGAGFMHRPDQRKAATFGAEHITQQAVKNIGRVDHQTLDAVEGDFPRAFGDAFGQAVELVVHGLAARQVGFELGTCK